jgi:hypothetical protein
MTDKLAQQDAIRAQRAQEAYERDWRRKQKEAAEKQQRLESSLREERIKQQQTREMAMATEAHTLKVEFFETLQRQKEIESKLKVEKDQKEKVSRTFSYAVKDQIKEKEGLKKKAKQEFFLEGMRSQKAANERLQKINQIKEQKIEVIINFINCFNY